jgi:hypothetical protein
LRSPLSAASVRDDEIDLGSALGFLAFVLLWYSTSCSSKSEVLVAAKMREEHLVLRVQRRPLAKVEVVGRLDETTQPSRLLLRRLLPVVIATKTWARVIVSSSLMIGSISVPCAMWIVDVKPSTSGM